jgi:ABC-2 type transport system ATP-binding protein
MGIIETRKLTKYYGKSRGVIDVDLTIEEGEIFGFIGPNGAGKSTTIRCLLNLIKPTSGKAMMFGLDCQKDYRKIHEEIGYLPSEVFYYDNMKVKDLLAYSASFFHKDCSAKIKELAKRLDLDLNKKIDDLSYGNKKKVGIIQGLLHSPKVIILDEPTGGLDPLMQQTFFQILKEENERGATILFSSHILSEVQKLCHRVAIIKEGRIVRIDTMASLQEDMYLKVEIETKDDLPATFVDASMSNPKIIDHSISFMYRGDANELIRKVANLDVARISMSEPDLEEIFMHYYEKE